MSEQPTVEPDLRPHALGPVFVARYAEREHSRACGLVTHPFCALAFCTSGKVAVEQGARWTVGEGDVLLVPAGAAHRSLSGSAAKLWTVGLSPSCLVAEAQSHLLEPFERVRSGAAAVVSIPSSRHEFVQQLFVELERELAHEQSGHEHVRNSLLTLLVSEVMRARVATDGTAPHSRSKHDDIVSASLRYIEQNCLGPLSLRDVADAVHRSPAHLTTTLKRATGLTVGAWIIAGRMAEARRRLLHTDELVDVIAERVGYADTTHFGRLFRHAHGATPRAFRARHRAPARD